MFTLRPRTCPNCDAVEERRQNGVERIQRPLAAEDARDDLQRATPRIERADDAARLSAGKRKLRIHLAVDLVREARRLRRHDLRLGSRQVAHKVHAVASQVHQRAAAEVGTQRMSSRRQHGIVQVADGAGSPATGPMRLRTVAASSHCGWVRI